MASAVPSDFATALVGRVTRGYNPSMIVNPTVVIREKSAFGIREY
jgi:hypothetical protein